MQKATQSKQQKAKTVDLLKQKIDFSKFFQSSPMPTVITTAKDGIIMDVNESVFKTSGYSRKEMVGKSTLSLSIWPDAATRKSVVNRIKKEGYVSDMTLQLKSKKGDIRDMEISSEQVTLDGVDYIITSFCDITDRVRSEQAIRESEDKYRSIVENSHEGILMSDDFSKIIFVNDQACAVTGYSKDGLLKTTLADVFGSGFPKAIKRLYKEVAANKVPEKLTWDFKNKKKEQKYLEIKVSSFQYAEKKDRVVIQLLDTTESQETKTALKETEERFFNILDLANDFIWEVDEKGKFTFLSSRMKDILGYDEKELLGKSPADIFSESEDIPKAKEATEAAWRERKPVANVERIFRHKDGHDVILESSSVPIFDGQRVYCGYRGVSRDITERKTAENTLKKREEELEIKTVLLEEANAALKVLLKQRERDKEEIEEKILMNVREMVLPFVEKMKLTKMDVIQEAYINIIESHLDDIISNFLQRIKSKTLTFTPRETQIASLIRAGKNTREITKMLGMSKSAVEFHRNRIRIKLGLNKKKINLRTSLLSIK